MRQRSSFAFAFAHINEAVRTHFKTIEEEPLPERWVDLILHLNAKERAQQQTAQHVLPERAEIKH